MIDRNMMTRMKIMNIKENGEQYEAIMENNENYQTVTDD